MVDRASFLEFSKENVVGNIRFSYSLSRGGIFSHQITRKVILAYRHLLSIAVMILRINPLHSLTQGLRKVWIVRIKPNATLVCPHQSLTTTDDAGRVNGFISCDNIHPSPLGYQVAIVVILIEVLFKWLSTPLCARTIVDIVPMSTPLQVVNTVVGLILILVVYLWEIVGIRYKSLRNKAMYLAIMPFTTVAEVNLQIPFPADAWFHKTTTTTPAESSLDSSEVANLVDAFGVDVFPNFFHFSWPKKRNGAYCRGLGQEMILSRNNSPIMGLSTILLARPRYNKCTTFPNDLATLL